ncbi:MAG: NADH-quinone oxidoreductase subunit C [Chitinophagaceae bacterium]|nr:MAG: NADH-quinone oxidoreductase subunit C [Chitinophagaceae bacterium]
MNNEALKLTIAELLPAASHDETGEWLNIAIDSNDWPVLAAQLRNNPSLAFDYLFCLTCVDFKTHLVMLYHLTSTMHRHHLVVKAQLDNSVPQIHTVSHIWKTANFHEREVYEMFGVKFINHPDLRLLILPDGWEGKNPLRKDFEDPINMIKL